MKGSPFHAGEQAVQQRLGVRERVEKMGQAGLRDYLPEQHREFFEALPFVIVGSADGEGRLWASLVPGEPGFVRSPTPRSLLLELAPLPGDPLHESLHVGAPLGLLGIELATRRRNRVNAAIVRAQAGLVELSVDQSFGNCKQYIQARAGGFTLPAERTAPSVEVASLSAAARAILARTDTAFIATSSRETARRGNEGLDVSHRGGLPGFVRAQSLGGGTRLTLPDYYGNFMFNTFGNLEVNPRAGLLALDFESGALLSLSGSAHVIWEGAEVAAVPGAERLLTFEVERGLLWQDVLRGWSAPEWSPQLLEL
jgi:predicted pyridoxine 5'-phosphate oxidase superfamily flavin-nucleotide-binding protein